MERLILLVVQSKLMINRVIVPHGVAGKIKDVDYQHVHLEKCIKVELEVVLMIVQVNQRINVFLAQAVSHNVLMNVHIQDRIDVQEMELKLVETMIQTLA